MRVSRRLLRVTCGALLVLTLGFSTALAGEVKGPPGTINNTNETGAASGLNDLDQSAGQTASQVQTAADSWKYYGLPKGSVGTWGLCRGGTGER